MRRGARSRRPCLGCDCSIGPARARQAGRAPASISTSKCDGASLLFIAHLLCCSRLGHRQSDVHPGSSAWRGRLVGQLGCYRVLHRPPGFPHDVNCRVSSLHYGAQFGAVFNERVLHSRWLPRRCAVSGLGEFCVAVVELVGQYPWRHGVV